LQIGFAKPLWFGYISAPRNWQRPVTGIRRGGRVAEGARLESVYTLIAYRGFESLPLRQYKTPAEMLGFFIARQYYSVPWSAHATKTDIGQHLFPTFAYLGSYTEKALFPRWRTKMKQHKLVLGIALAGLAS